jgi:hypothetical protein
MMARIGVTENVTTALAKRHPVTDDTATRRAGPESILPDPAGTCIASCARTRRRLASGTALAHAPVSPAFGQWSPEAGLRFTSTVLSKETQ